MHPLRSVPVPTFAARVGITRSNSWLTRAAEKPVRLAYIATDSGEQVSFVSLESTVDAANILGLAVRRSLLPDMPDGVVVEVYLASDLPEDDTLFLSLAQAGASAYFPPQQIDDRNDFTLGN